MVTVHVPLFSSSTCILVATIFIVYLHWVHSCVHWEMRVSSIYGSEKVSMVTAHVPLFSSSTCITSSRKMRVSNILEQNLNAIKSSILVQREYHWWPSLYLCLAQVRTYSSSYIYCSPASGPQLCALGNESVKYFETNFESFKVKYFRREFQWLPFL
jgi:hypothetical protein